VSATTARIDLGGDEIPDETEVVRYEVREAISFPYEVVVEISLPITDTSFKFHKLLRTSAALKITDEDENSRIFHGVIDRAEYLFFSGTDHHFRLRLRPSLASLAHRENCKIWQDTNVVDVVKEIFEEAGIDNAEWQTYKEHASRSYIVQYRESELNFMHRLFEDECLFYFFRHTPEGHKMIISDDAGAFQQSDDAPEVHFAMSQGYDAKPIDDFRRTRSVACNDVTLRDYNFELPQVPPEGAQPGTEVVNLPFYGYPGGFIDGTLGTMIATATLRSRRHASDVSVGASRAIGLRCGVPFSVEGAGQVALNGNFVVTELITSGEQTLESGGDNEVCQNRFKAIPEETPYLPPRIARRPRIWGMQTAITTGPSTDNQAIHVDKYGRVKVRFYWDRINQQDDTSSCWLRVTQLATGGTMLLPRVGWEIAVAFHEGDPDRPFAMGRFYNGEIVPPAGLPGAKASGGLKSYSTPGGAGINEINLSDSAGSMGWTLNAQKDLNVVIGHDKNETIAVDTTHDVKVQRQDTIGSNLSLSVGADQSEDVGSVRSMNVTGNQTIDVGANEVNNATSNMLETVSGNRDYEVGANMTTICNTVMQTVGGNVSRTVGALELNASIASITDKIGGSYTEDVAAIKAELMIGTSSEKVGGAKDQVSIAAELHLISGGYALEGEATVTYLTGGVHYRKVDGDYTVKGTLVTLLGATGDFKGGKGNLKLGGGPVLAKGSKIAATGALLVKMSSSMKMG